MTQSDAIRRAVTLMMAGELDQAESVCRQILRTRPKWAAAYNVLGVIKYRQGAIKEAIKSVQKAIELTGGVADYHVNLGEMLRQDGQTDMAIMALREATHLDPKLASAFNGLGLTYFDKSQFEFAVNMYKKAITLNPNYPQAYFNLGNTLARLGKDSRASECFSKAVELCAASIASNNNYISHKPTDGETMSKKWLLLARGAPGAGKTTFFQGLGLGRFVIDPDTIRSKLGVFYEEIEGNQRKVFYDETKVSNMLHHEIKKRMQHNEPIIVDATFQRIKKFYMPLILAKDFGYSAVVIDFTMISEETAQNRNEIRKSQRYVSPELISKAYRNFGKEPLPNNVISIPYVSFAESELCRMMKDALRTT